MSKKKILSRKQHSTLQPRTRRRYVVVTLGLLLTLCLGIVGPLRNSWGVTTVRSLFAPPPLPPPSNPSKEYIYAGSKLIATEEPVTLAAPTSLTATTISEPPTPLVNITWTATPGADHYEVERTTNIASNYVPVDLHVSDTSFTDNTVSSITSYLYRVRAVGSAGAFSAYSNVDLATAISFTDNSLTIGSSSIKAVHLTQLRQAVNAVRAVTTTLGQVNWPEEINNQTRIKASYIQELRTNLDQALDALGMAPCEYTNASSGLLIQKAHIEELRKCVK